MKLIFAVIFCVVLGSSGFGQSAELPDVLSPDANAVAEAKRLDARVFKILPRGTFKQPEGSYKDEDNPIGIREGGSYYSFSKGLHSYNKVPQIELQGEEIQVGFYGTNYGLMADLGPVSLADVSDDLPATQFLLGYTPPKLRRDIESEYRRTGKIEVYGQIFSHRLAALEGHSYLLRAISFGEADKLVALQIISKDKDGSLAIVWKSIKDFEVPRVMMQTEDQLRATVYTILNKPEYSGVTYKVTDDVVTITGTAAKAQIPRIVWEVNRARPGKLVNLLTEK